MEKLNLTPEKETSKKPRDQAIGEIALEENSKVERVRTWAERYYKTEKSYATHRKKVQSLEYEDLEDWENRAKISFDAMKNAEKGAGFRNRYERDNAERIGTLNPDESIEGDAGKFYRRRNRALIQAIEDSDDAEKQADLTACEELYRYVAEHLYYEHDYSTRNIDPACYNARRRSAHNALINHLNKINDIARKYGVTPLTFRNFEDNDFRYDAKLDIGDHTNARAEFDRSCVEAYCRNAFSGEYERAEKDES